MLSTCAVFGVPRTKRYQHVAICFYVRRIGDWRYRQPLNPCEDGNDGGAARTRVLHGNGKFHMETPRQWSFIGDIRGCAQKISRTIFLLNKPSLRNENVAGSLTLSD